jgi:hypothetical protein
MMIGEKRVQAMTAAYVDHALRLQALAAQQAEIEQRAVDLGIRLVKSDEDFQVFVAPTCSVCFAALPAAAALWQGHMDWHKQAEAARG